MGLSPVRVLTRPAMMVVPAMVKVFSSIQVCPAVSAWVNCTVNGVSVAMPAAMRSTIGVIVLVSPALLAKLPQVLLPFTMLTALLPVVIAAVVLTPVAMTGPPFRTVSVSAMSSPALMTPSLLPFAP